MVEREINLGIRTCGFIYIVLQIALAIIICLQKLSKTCTNLISLLSFIVCLTSQQTTTISFSTLTVFQDNVPSITLVCVYVQNDISIKS